MFTKACFAILFGLLPVITEAQTVNLSADVTVRSRQEVIIKPRFRGSLNDYIVRNVKYPEKARENGVQGKCIVEFMVDEKGVIQRVGNIKSSGNKLLDAEAERLIASMPAWRPGTCDQRPIRYFYSLPINFELH